MLQRFTNIVGTMPVSEIDFIPEDKPNLLNTRYFLIASGLKDGVYDNYVYAMGDNPDGSGTTGIMCYTTMFNRWRYTFDDDIYHMGAVIEIILNH